MHIDTKQSRRSFLHRAAQLGTAGVAAPLIGSLGLLGEAAAAASGSGYKALVCVFQYGGNDNHNTLAPFDNTSHAAYLAARSRIAIPRTQLAGTALVPANNLGGRQFALNPALQPLLPIFSQGKLAPLLNVGALVEPTSKAAYLAKAVRLPPKLFSHNDQQSYNQAFAPEGANAGWGGRMGDLLQASNGNAALTCISLQGRALWLSGNKVTPYTAQAGGVTGLLPKPGGSFVSGSASMNALRNIMAVDQRNNWIAQEHSSVVTRALTLSDTVSRSLSYAPDTQFTTFANNGNALADQLKMVARLISVGPMLGLRRQVFFVGHGGYDTHSGQAGRHPLLLGELAQGLSEFYAATNQIGMADQVTTFTMSDFGRNLADNGDGSDHGWGSTHFIMGGSVKGGRIYGTPPAVGLNTNDDVNNGRFIPTTSIEQMAGTLALWFGVAPADLPQLMPNIVNFNTSSWNLGFV